jgi:hypothetical protein
MIETLVTQNSPRATAWGYAATAGALILVWLTGHLALPGLSPDALAETRARMSPGSLTIFALGVTPILTSWFVVGLAQLVIPPLSRLRPGRLELAASALALLFAGVQASGVAAAVQSIRGLVDDPGPAFRAEIIATMVGATAILLWLAAVIDRSRVGDGLLILFAGQTLAAAVRRLALLFELVRLGRIEPSAAWAAVAAILAGGGLAAFAARSRRGLDPWPPLLAFGVGALLPTAAILVANAIGAPVDAVVEWLTGSFGRTTLAVLTAAMFGLVALMRSGDATLDAKALAAQILVVLCGGMLWVVSPLGGSTSGCAFLLFACAVTSVFARGQPRLGFG